MLVSQRRVSGSGAGHGSLRTVLAELERQAATPSRISDGLRQRLLVLSQRLARVQSLGNECARVALSEHVQGILGEPAPAD
jgi:hypothetical protein